jgi:hypothetical protein
LNTTETIPFGSKGCIMLGFTLRLFSSLALSFSLHVSAATVNDIQGEWIADGAATWASMKNAPQIVALPPEQQKMIQEMILTQSASMVSMISADKLISSQGEQKKEASYKVTGITGDKISTEVTDASGKVEKIDIMVKGDTLTLSNVDQPGVEMVLKRKPTAVK